MDVMGKVADVLTGSGKGLKDLRLEDGGGQCAQSQMLYSCYTDTSCD
jgi:hypothetical protein